jgi:hypothetical protein
MRGNVAFKTKSEFSVAFSLFGAEGKNVGKLKCAEPDGFNSCQGFSIYEKESTNRI